MNMKQVCVLGGTGFVGKHLFNRLVEEGRRVKVLTRRRERHRELLVLPTVSVVEADVYDTARLTRELRGCDAAINLVGILNEKGRDGSGFMRAHVALADTLLQACNAAAVSRLLHMSALNADAKNGPSFYLRSKGQAENRVHAANPTVLSATSFRPSVIFGPEDSFINRFADLLKLSPLVFPLACPESRFAPVYVGDIVEAFAGALEDESTYGERYNLCGPRDYTLKELVEYTASVLGVKRRIIGLSQGLSRLQANVLEFAPGKPFSRDNYLSLTRDSVCPDGKRCPTSLESIVPYYLGQRGKYARYSRFRRSYWLPDDQQEKLP
ncbi:MAG: complex I NDUFA9 subunit family protein [Gammaproteobacteria bacterium]